MSRSHPSVPHFRPSHVYGLQRPHLFRFLEAFAPDSQHVSKRAEAVVGCFLSYVLTVYGFGLAYLFVSRAAPTAFAPTQLTLFTAVYFSLTTAATVGFGDITPALLRGLS